MKKFWVRIFLLFIVYCVLFYPLELLMDKKYSHNFIVCNKGNWILSKKNERYDWVILGSSRALNAVSSVQLAELSEKKVINIATSGSNFAENFIYLQQFLENGNKFKVLLLQADIYCLNSPTAYSHPFNEQNLIHLFRKPDVQKVIRDYVNPIKFYLWKYIPYSRYMEYGFHYSLYKAIKGGYECEGAEWNKTMGYEELLEKAKETEQNDIKKKQFQVNEKDLEYLNKIVELCQANQIKVVLFCSPEYPSFVNQAQDTTKLLEFYYYFCQQHHLPAYIYLHQMEKWNDKSFFKDETHINAKGVAVFTQDLSEVLNQMELPQ